MIVNNKYHVGGPHSSGGAICNYSLILITNGNDMSPSSYTQKSDVYHSTYNDVPGWIHSKRQYVHNKTKYNGAATSDGKPEPEHNGAATSDGKPEPEQTGAATSDGKSVHIR
jgi:hypothetical protein